MGFRITLVLLAPVLFFSNLSAQTSISVELEKQRERIPMDVALGQSTIQVCGLIPGTTYSVVAVSGLSGEKVRMVLTMTDVVLEQEARTMSRLDRPQHRQFVARDSCVEFSLLAGDGQQSGVTPIYLSVGCVDCPEATAFMEKFMNKVESMGMANLTTTGGASASTLVTTLIGGDCFQVSGASSTGPTQSRGTFNNGATNIGINTGVVLCTGNVASLPGPNNAGNTSANTAGFNVNSPDDADLENLVPGNQEQFDVIKLEFDFTPTAESVSFEYVFGSEEYCEFVNSNFNDIFGFFVSGPGIPGGVQNIALLPVGGNPPVAINNVNHLTNTAFYVNNNTNNPCQNVGACCQPECALDGWTSVLTATVEDLIPCSTYHIKLAIADIADGLYFSAVFLKANSFNAGGVVKANPTYPQGFQYVIESCNGGFIRFFRAGGDINQPLVVTFTISGSATPGDDYDPLPTTITIPAGATFFDLPVNVLSDLIIEGEETIVITLDNPCSCNLTQSTFLIHDKEPLEVELEDIDLCGANSATLTPDIVSPGQPPLTYLWSNNLTTPSITVNTPGTNTYTVTVTDDCGETATAEATVTLTPSPTAALTGSGAFCANQPDTVNLTLTFTGIGPWVVEIDNNGTTETYTYTSSPVTYTVSDPGTYSLVSVATQSGCTGTATGSVTLDEITVTLTVTPTDPPCFGANNGSATASASGGNGPFTYAWSNNGSGPSQSGLAPGSYMVTATNAQGCTAEESFTLTEPPQLTASLTNTGNIDCNNPTGSADLEVDGGTPGYTFNWSGGSGGQNPTFSAGGTYTVTVSDANNCTVTASVTITSNLTPPVAAATVNGQIDCNNNEITINGNGSSQGPNFTYEWNGPGLTCCETTLEPTVNAGGTYTLTVTNSDNGCTATVAVNVVQNITPPNAVIAAPQNISCNLPTLSLNGNGSSQGPNFTFEWSTSGGNFTCCTNTLTPQVNQAGTYTILVTNTNNGCTAEATVTVDGNTDPPTATIEPPAVVDCNNPELELDASGSSQGGNITYQWGAGGGGNITGGGNTTNPTINAGGTYTITVTNTDNNCTATASVTVTASLTPPVAVAASPPTLTCLNPEITINGNGSSQGPNFTYEWTANPGNIVSGDNTLNPVVDEAGSYTLVVTNTDNGCTSSTTVNVNSNQDYPDADAGPSQTLNCANPNLQLQGSGSSGNGITIQWTANPGNITGGANTYSPTINQPGTYTLVVTNTANGCSSTSEVTIDSNFDIPIATIEPPGVVNCNTPELELDASGSSQGGEFTYNWAANPGNITGGGNTTNPTINQAGTYTITVTNTDNGCTATASVSITSNLTPPVAVAATPPTLTCANPELTINGNGSSQGPDFTYEWTANPGNIVSGDNTLNPVIDEAGSYTLVVTNQANGCTSSTTVNVNSNQDYPDADAGPSQTLNCTHPNLQLQGSGSSGNGITIQWTANPGNITGGANTYSPTINQPGTYTLVVTNTANGCSSTSEVTIDSNFDLPIAQIAPPIVVDCTNPTIEIDGSGSSQGGEFTYNWAANPGNITGGGNTTNPTVNQAGTYTITVTNTDNGCTATASVTVTSNLTPPVAVAANPPVLTCANPELTINGNGSSQGPDFTYEWTANPGNIVSGENTLNPVIDEAGSYTLIVTNQANGCTSSTTVNVNSNQNYPTANAGPDQTLNCTHPNLQLQGSGSSGNGITIQWTANPGNIVSGANTYSPTINQPGTYTLVVTNTANGCSSTSEVTIDSNFDIPTAQINPPLVVDCNNPTVEIDGSGSSQGQEFTYNWAANPGNITGGGNTTNPTVNQAGTYTITVTNTDNGCTATASVSVTSNLTLPVAVAANPPLLTCQNPELTLNGNGSSEGPEFTYEWTTGNGNIVSGETTLNPVIDQSGSYTLVVTNQANGCTKAVTVNVSSNQNFPSANAGPDQTLNCVHPTAQLQGSGTNPPGVTIQWTANPGNIVSGANTYSPTVNQPGTYTLVVTNTSNGCSTTAEVTIDANFDVPVATIAPPQVINCYNPSIELDAGGSSQGPDYGYNWTATPGNIQAGGTTPYPVINQPGTYNLTVTNTASGCTATASVSVTANLTLPTALAATPGLLTCQNPQLTLNGNGSSQGPEFTYEWTTGSGNIVSGETTLNPVIDQPGSYTLVVTNQDNGCTKAVTVNVSSNQNFPNVAAGPEYLLNCVNPSLQLQGSGSNGSGFVIQWTANPGNIVSGANTYSPTINQPGTYYVVVTNTANGCTAEDFVQIDANFDQPVAVIAAPDVVNCYNPVVELDASGSSQGPDDVFVWSTVNGNIVSGANTPNPEVSQGGTYNLLVSNVVSGCTATASVTVQQNLTLPNANAGPGATLSCAVAQLTLNATGSSGPNFQYEWWTPDGNIVSGENSLNPVIDQPGSYTLVVTNSVNGCTRQSTVNILADQNAPTAYSGSDGVLTCTSQSLQLNGFGSSTGNGITYQWVANPGNIVSGANTLTPTVNAFGFYTLIVTNTANGCTDEDEVFIDDNIVYPTANIAPAQQLNCAFTTVELDASGSSGDNLTFAWTPNNKILSGQGTSNPEVGQTGTYNLVVTNQDNGCTATASVTVTQDIAPPVAVAVPTASITCQSPQTTLNGTGSSSGYPFFYEWTTTNGNIVSGYLTLNPIVNQVGTYTLTVSNIENGCTSTATVQVITQQTFPTANAGPAQTITCAVQQMNLDGSGSSQGQQYTYVWTTQNGNIVSGANTLSPLVNAPGVYELSVVNTQTGCTSTASVTVGQNTANPQASVAPGGELSCTVTSLVLDGTNSSTGGNFTYNWTTATGNIVSGQGTLSLVVDATGTYNLVVTNTANGCTSSASTVVTADASIPTANAGPATTLTCLVSEITLNATASSQGSEFSYNWTGPGIVSGGNTLTPTINAAGTYTLQISNTANGCTASSNVLIPADVVLPVAAAGAPAVLNCVDTLLTLQGNASSTGQQFTYAWTASAGGNILSGANTLAPQIDQPGAYTLLVTNTTNGCTATDEVNIAQNTVLPAANAGAPGLITCTNATVTLTGSGSTGPEFAYMWSTANGSIAGGANTLSPVVDAPGLYNLLVTNTTNGCTAVSAVAVAKDANVPVATAAVPGPLTCAVTQIQLNGTGTTTGPTLQYTWTTATGNIVSGGNTLNPTVNQPGQYTLNVFNSANN
ncbi:MAG: choice-of-anchor L domain-containing protein, partial [Saprospiraceae bacterium]|nr:choice-of-anchor L domain-containing protein [Saprospiraceae bacterium]